MWTAGVRVRDLRAEDLGEAEDLLFVRGTVELDGSVLVVRIDMISGSVRRPFSVLRSLCNLARRRGATHLCVIARLANEDLAELLKARYKLLSEGGMDVLWMRV